MASTNSSPTSTAGPILPVNASEQPKAQATTPSPQGQELYPNGVPEPRGTHVAEGQETTKGDSSDPTTGTGVDGELTIWEARYSNRNFIARGLARMLMTFGWGGLAYYTWGYGHENLALVTWIALGGLVLFWGGLIWRMVQAHFSHYYKLTNRRLFVSTGVIHRRRDMLELLRVKDVFARQQSLLERWMSLGTVVVEPNDKSLPTFYLAGVDDPKQVMDLIWHHARAERDQRSVKVDSV